MKKEYIVAAKTVEEAIVEARIKYASEGELSFEVLEMPKKGFLGIGSSPAKIKVTVEEEEEDLMAIFGASKKDVKPAEPKKEEKFQNKKENKPAQNRDNREKSEKKQENADKREKPVQEKKAPKAEKPKQEQKKQAFLEKEKRRQEAILHIKRKYGKNAILRGMNLTEGATAAERNRQIGGHKA